MEEIFIAIYMVVLYFCKRTKLPQTLSVILLICVSLEGFSATLINWGEQIADVGWASRTNYRSFISRISIATDMIQKEDDSFYRMEKTIFRKPNDAFALNMRGVSEFNSTFNQGVVLKKTGFVSRAQSSKYFSGNEVIDSILGIKYVIGDGHHEDGTPVDSVSGLYDKTYIKDGNMYIYKNPFALPIAYAVDDRVLYNGILYKVITAHASQADWMPDVSPSLFAKVLIPDENVIPEWEQPDSTNPYMTGDKVMYEGKVWVSTVDHNVWVPGAYGWEEY